MDKNNSPQKLDSELQLKMTPIQISDPQRKPK